MSSIKLMCRTLTPFSADGKIDEAAMRWHLRRLVENRIGIYPASGGVGEAYAMTMAEIRRVYDIAVDECKGKVPVYANPPEQHTADGTIAHARIAIEAGCDAVNVYPIAGWHGFRPREEELRGYYDTILTQIKHPVTLTASAVGGQMPPARLIADVVNKHRQIIGVNLHGGDGYFVELKDRVSRDVDYYCHLTGSLNEFLLGANGMLCQEATIIPKSFRQFINHYEKGEFAQMGPLNAGILRFISVIAKWSPGNARPTKMCMAVLKLPGWQGGSRPPNVIPGADQLDALLDGLRKVGLPEIDEMLRAAAG